MTNFLITIKDQFSQVLGYSKNNFQLYCGSYDKFSNTRVNTITVKKNKKIKINLSQIKYYNYHKKKTILPINILINSQKTSIS